MLRLSYGGLILNKHLKYTPETREIERFYTGNKVKTIQKLKSNLTFIIWHI